MTPEICLGTAQFGLAYGITNTAGQVNEDSVASLLIRANEAGINMLDTAQAYGNAEAVLGRNQPEAKGFQLISKLPAQVQPEFIAQDTESWDQSFRDSCQRLGVFGLDSLLLHSASDLRKPGSQHLEDWMLGLRETGLVRRIGVSIYSAEDLNGINQELLDLVQLPLSLYDQRLLQDGTVPRIHAHGTAIHARSIYLQGLLLTPAELWPNWVNPHVRSHHQALEALARQRNCQLIDLALGFAHAQADLEAVVVGICNGQELKELENAWSAISPWQGDEWRDWALKDSAILDPRQWPR